jgi:hypothetical protein
MTEKFSTAKRQSVVAVVAMMAAGGIGLLVAGPAAGFLALLGTVGGLCRLLPPAFGPEDYTE